MSDAQQTPTDDPQTLADLWGKFNTVELGVEDDSGQVVAIFKKDGLEVYCHTFKSVDEVKELVDILYSGHFPPQPKS